jgi:hypothetical protein
VFGVIAKVFLESEGVEAALGAMQLGTRLAAAMALACLLIWALRRGGGRRAAVTAPPAARVPHVVAPVPWAPDAACDAAQAQTMLAGLPSSERKVFSQNGEDGVIEHFFRHMGAGRKRYVEFGVEDGQQCNSRRLREEAGWTGLMMDGGPAHPAINLQHEMLFSDIIVQLFEKHGVEKNVDFLSIDLDSSDLWIWRQLLLAGYRARLVCIEFNRNFPDGLSLVFPPGREMYRGTMSMGASLTALEILAHEFDYTLIYTDKVGINAFFVPRSTLCGATYQWHQTNNEPLHRGFDPAMVVYLGSGRWRKISRILVLPPGDVDLKSPLSVRDSSTDYMRKQKQLAGAVGG